MGLLIWGNNDIVKNIVNDVIAIMSNMYGLVDLGK